MKTTQLLILSLGLTSITALSMDDIGTIPVRIDDLPLELQRQFHVVELEREQRLNMAELRAEAEMRRHLMGLFFENKGLIKHLNLRNELSDDEIQKMRSQENLEKYSPTEQKAMRDWDATLTFLRDGI